jgi:hypothetical protein
MAINSKSLFKKWVKDVSWLLHWNGFTEETPVVVDRSTVGLIDKEIERTTIYLSELVRLHKTPEEFRKLYDAIGYADDLLKRVKIQSARLAAGDLSWLTVEARRQYVQWEASLTPRAECQHMKGGEMSRFGWDKYAGMKGNRNRDYSVAHHRFSDGREKIWCLQGCGFVSWMGDENWSKAREMMKQSTNSTSGSERFALKTGRTQ